VCFTRFKKAYFYTFCLYNNCNFFKVLFLFYFTLLINKCSQISISNQLLHPFCNLVGKKGKFEIVHRFLIRRKKNELWGRQFDCEIHVQRFLKNDILYFQKCSSFCRVIQHICMIFIFILACCTYCLKKLRQDFYGNSCSICASDTCITEPQV
jgi:hypothetical protein